MKRFLLNVMLMLMAGQMTGQHMVVGNSDFIGHGNRPNHAFLLEGNLNEFYWITGSSYENVTHPLLQEEYTDYECLYFIKYDPDGNAVSSNNLYGTSYARRAFSHQGDLFLFSTSEGDVSAGGSVLPINQSEQLEFLARYDAKGALVRIISIWNTPALVYPQSFSAMDQRDGSVYIFGSNTVPLEVNGSGVIGEEWPDEYCYVLKYSRDLAFQWAYTAGFEKAADGFGYFTDLMAYPDISGNVVITGSYESDMTQLQFGPESLPSYADGQGLFAVKLNAEGTPQWVQGGTSMGYGSQTCIYDGFAMENGDLVLAGMTGSGYFQLGDASFSFPDGAGFLNQFVYRMGPDGSVRWSRQFQNMAYPVPEEKKATRKTGDQKAGKYEEFAEYRAFDAIVWKDRVLYLSGNFTSDALVVAGEELTKSYPEGIYLAAVDLRDGDERWGYALSAEPPAYYPNHLFINGLDVDRFGNVTIMGTSGELQEFGGIGKVSVPGTDLIFHLGLNYQGNPIWYNNAHLQEPGPELYASDLEVLANGVVFSSMNMEISGSLVTEYDSLNTDFPCTNWLIAFKASMELSGKVLDPAGAPVYPGLVKAVRSVPTGAFPVVDSVMLDDAGGYMFRELYPGHYTLQAIADPEKFPNAAPTYLGDHVVWSDAQFYDFGPEDQATFLDIMIREAPQLTPQDGSGTMSGNVSYEDGVELKHTLARPVKKASVILVKTARKSTLSGEVAAYAETDELGNYIFENVPDGDYLLIVDIAGLPMIDTYEVTIVGNQIVGDLDYTVGIDGIDIPGGVHVSFIRMDHFLVFPNPGDGKIRIDAPRQEEYRVRVYGTDGKMVRSVLYPSGAGIRLLDISGEDPGLYLIRIEGTGLSAVMKYILK